MRLRNKGRVIWLLERHYGTAQAVKERVVAMWNDGYSSDRIALTLREEAQCELSSEWVRKYLMRVRQQEEAEV